MFDNLRKRKPVRTKDWLEENIDRMPSESLTNRLSFRQFPHVVGVLDAFDDPRIHELTLQWGARQGKTQTSLFILAATLINNPSPCAFADADQDSLIRVFKRFWKLLNINRVFQEILPRIADQRQDFIETSVACVYGAWAGSPSKAADYSARLVLKNETDKMMTKSTRAEADFRMAMNDRAIGYKDRKIINMSTPTIKGESYIEERRLLGDNRAWMVPCFHCGEFQQWKTGNGKDPGGLRYDRLPDGRHHATLAEETAWYECEHCRGRIEEKHRASMCQAGIWVPEGCSVSKGQITGTPARSGDHASFASPHILSVLTDGITIGKIAKERVNALLAPNRSDAIRNWINSWEGKTWDPAPPIVEKTIIQQRLGATDGLGLPLQGAVCPEWTKFCTMGVDVSKMGEQDFQFHWWLSAWGTGGRGQLVDIGTALGRKAFRALLQDRTWRVQGRDGAYRPVKAYVDSGAGGMSQAIYEFCDSCRSYPVEVAPIKGSSDLIENGFSKNEAGNLMSKGGFRGQKKPWQKKLMERRRQWDLILVNTTATQNWLEDRLQGRIGRDEPTFYSIPPFYLQISEDQPIDVAKHLLGDYLRDGVWTKRYDEQHFRDALRYSVVAAYQHTKDGAEWETLADTVLLTGPGVDRTAFEVASDRGMLGPNGMAFLATNRG